MVGLNNSRRNYLSDLFSNCNLEDMHKCRQVSQSWNVMISQITKYKKDTIKTNADNLAGQIRAKWVIYYHGDFRLYEIVTAASLAHHGVLGSVEMIVLHNIDLRSVPAMHLASLTSSLTIAMGIMNVWISDLSPILDNVKCKVLSIRRQSLSSEETQKLVRIMDSTLERMFLYREVSLDITALTQYNGTGSCARVSWYGDQYTEEVKSWVRRIYWEVIHLDDGEMVIRRKEEEK